MGRLKDYMIDWRLHYHDGLSLWVVHRKDGIGGAVTCREVRIEPGVELRTVGKFLQCHAELLVRGRTHFEGNDHVDADIVRLRHVAVRDQAIRIPVVGTTRAKVRTLG